MQVSDKWACHGESLPSFVPGRSGIVVTVSRKDVLASSLLTFPKPASPVLGEVSESSQVTRARYNACWKRCIKVAVESLIAGGLTEAASSHGMAPKTLTY